MSLLTRLFGGASTPKPEPGPKPEPYNGFVILPQPAREAAGYRIAARIEKEIDGALQTHMMIRADTYADQAAAIAASITKAKQVIDEQGDAVFH